MPFSPNLKKLQSFPSTRVGKVLNAVRWFDGYAPFPPRYVEIALTYRCNLSCRFCYQDQRRRRTDPDLTLANAEVIAQSLEDSFAVKPRIYLFGGEAMVNAEFVEIYRLFSERGFKLLMTTNGVRVRTFIDELAASSSLTNLAVSVNSLDFDGIRATLALLDEHGPGYPVALNCPVDLAFQAGISLDAIVREFEGSPVRYLCFQHSQTVFLHDATYDTADVARQVQEVSDESYDLPVMFFPPIRVRDLEAYYSDASFPSKDKKCVLPWFDLFIRPDGTVTPCDEIDVTVGNAFEESLGAIWNGPRLRAFRRSIQAEGNSQPFCTRCCHRQYY